MIEYNTVLQNYFFLVRDRDPTETVMGTTKDSNETPHLNTNGDEETRQKKPKKPKKQKKKRKRRKDKKKDKKEDKKKSESESKPKAKANPETSDLNTDEERRTKNKPVHKRNRKRKHSDIGQATAVHGSIIDLTSRSHEIDDKLKSLKVNFTYTIQWVYTIQDTQYSHVLSWSLSLSSINTRHIPVHRLWLLK